MTTPKMIVSWLAGLAVAGVVLVGTAIAQTSPPAAGDARQVCTAAMNADPKFAAEIVKVADERAQLKRDADTLAAHVDAYHHVQRNERHVIYAYAAMWIIAIGFVIYLWRRQAALLAVIAHLRRVLDAAEAGGKGRT
jgi:hypothetical protein